MTNTNIYSLAFRPGTRNLEDVKRLKMILRKILGVHYKSENSEAHISLLSYEATPAQHKLILFQLRKIIGQLSPFTIQYEGFGNFKSTLLIKLKPESEITLKNYAKRIKKNIRKYSSLIQNNGNNPHMSIARGLSDEQLILARQLPEERRSDDQCDFFVIRKFNSIIGQYEVIATIPLLGNPNHRGEQLALFANDHTIPEN